MEKPKEVSVTEEAAPAWRMAAGKFPERACHADLNQHKDRRRRRTPTQMDLHHHQPFSPHSAVWGASSQEDTSWSFKPDLCYPPNKNTARYTRKL